MDTRLSRNLALAATFGLCAAFLADASVAREVEGVRDPKAELQLLFVHSAMSGDYDGKNLTLHRIGSTLVFSDRPNRVTGHMRTSKFVSQWGQGPASFASNPPNATLSIFSEKGPENAVVVLKDPKLDGENLRYAVEVLDGKIPSHIGESTLFIDVMGRGAAFLGGAMVGRAVTRANETSSSTTYVQQSPPPPCTCNCN